MSWIGELDTTPGRYMLSPLFQELLASVSSLTSHEIGFFPAAESVPAEGIVWPVSGGDERLHGSLHIRTTSIADEHRDLYRQLSRIIGHEIDLRQQNFSLANRFRLADKQNAELAALNRALSEMAHRDPLTRTFQRWYLLEQIRLEVARCSRQGNDFSLLLVAIDGFEEINAFRGSSAGDLMLRKMANLLERSSRTSDIICRFGDDQFAMLLTDTPLEGAADVAQRIVSRCREEQFANGSARIDVTCSIGVVSFRAEGGNSEERMIDALARLLLAAKRSGGNVAVIGSAALEPA